MMNDYKSNHKALEIKVLATEGKELIDVVCVREGGRVERRVKNGREDWVVGVWITE